MLDKLRIKNHTNATRNSSQLSIEFVVYLWCVVEGVEVSFKNDIRKSKNLLGKYVHWSIGTEYSFTTYIKFVVPTKLWNHF